MSKKWNSRTKPSGVSHKNGKIFTLGIIISGLTFIIAMIMISKNKPLSFNEKVNCLGLPNDFPKETLRKHVWISENANMAPRNPSFTPIHILYRENGTSSWKFNGTGTLLNKRQGWMVTAHHVLEDKPGQFGYRLISTNEFIKNSRVFPIIACEQGTDIDDAIFCQVNATGTEFPFISLTDQGNRFSEFNTNSDYSVQYYPAKIHFLTYPETKTIEGAFWVEVRPGVKHIYFKNNLENGESGTGAVIESLEDNALLIIIKTHTIIPSVFPQVFLDQIGWKNGQEFGVGHLIQIN